MMKRTVDVCKPLKRIVTNISKGEYALYSVEFFFVDGSSERMGGTDADWANGRTQTINFAAGEILLGAVLHHSDRYTLGIEWITGRLNE